MLNLNGGTVIDEYKEEIYKGLKLKKENEDDWQTHFLDLQIKVNGRQVYLSTYDKRDGFPFKARSFPDVSINIHFAKTHNVILGQLKRFSVCSHFSSFSERAVALTTKLQKQGFAGSLLELRVRKFYVEHEERVRKFKKTEEGFVRGCFEEGESHGKST